MDDMYKNISVPVHAFLHCMLCVNVRWFRCEIHGAGKGLNSKVYLCGSAMKGTTLAKPLLCCLE